MEDFRRRETQVT